ncbi:Nt-Gln-amidase domain-containing protein [Mycena indigotica]|uniref:Protein N-terminal glutamine amidohydrolase n=1 Tax=Mycena indigotica TaxID=2126181 RepID=A0A8H6S8P9_9AGAR|nr:Nt-Gln-amidase domain-containing protein [Mycena indigotica]KAF7295055.1 Nt-Gln-amidase domain-containing protein [Mycena indigotica]
MSTHPPAIPETTYTPFYCEENVWRLCDALSRQSSPLDASAVFISNEYKTVALFEQKQRLPVVVWDYHVVLLLRDQDKREWIYDFDTCIPCPCPLKEYLRRTFSPNIPPDYKREVIPFHSTQSAPLNFRSLLRLVPAKVFLDYFASDRSHMLDESGSYQAPPPKEEPIRGRMAVGNNLMEFVNMDEGSGHGIVVEVEELQRHAESLTESLFS